MRYVIANECNPYIKLSIAVLNKAFKDLHVNEPKINHSAKLFFADKKYELYSAICDISDEEIINEYKKIENPV